LFPGGRGKKCAQRPMHKRWLLANLRAYCQVRERIVEVERVVEVPVDRIVYQEREVPVERIVYQEREVQVPVFKEVTKEVIKEVPVERIVYKDREVKQLSSCHYSFNGCCCVRCSPRSTRRGADTSSPPAGSYREGYIPG